MNFELTEEQIMIQQAARDFAQNELLPGVIERDEHQKFPTEQIKKLGEYIELHHRSAVIFPEGTRSKTGKPKEFAQSGLKILCKYAPSAFVVPITINNSWKFVKFGFFPFGLGNRLTFTVHKPMAVKDFTFEALMNKTETTIINSIIKI